MSEIGNKFFKRMARFKYLRTAVSNDSCVQSELRAD